MKPKKFSNPGSITRAKISKPSRRSLAKIFSGPVGPDSGDLKDVLLRIRIYSAKNRRWSLYTAMMKEAASKKKRVTLIVAAE